MRKVILIAVMLVTVVSLMMLVVPIALGKPVTVCDFVRRFGISNRPEQIGESDLEYLKFLGGIGGSRARSIEAWIKEHGPITSEKELRSVPGIEDLANMIGIFFALKGYECPPTECEQHRERLIECESALQDCESGQGLSQCRTDLSACRTDLSACRTDLSSSNQQLNSCNQSRSSAKRDLDRYLAQLRKWQTASYGLIGLGVAFLGLTIALTVIIKRR